MRKQIEKVKNTYKQLSAPVKASFWYTICNVLNKGIALLSTPIFTRMMTEEQYGKFMIFQSWYNILFIFTSLNIFLGGYTKGLLLYRNDKDRFTSSLLALTTVITAVFLFIYLIGMDFWTRIFDLSPILMLLMFVELMFMPALEFWSAKERFNFKYKKYVIVTLLMSFLSLTIGAIAVMCSTDKVEARVFADVLSKTIFTLVLFIIIFVKGKKIYVKEYWIYALTFNLPLLPHYLSNFVLNQSDRIMISQMIGDDKAAFYSVAYTISMMMMLLVSAINNSLTPYIYKMIDKTERNVITINETIKKISNITKSISILIAGLCIITMAFAPEVVLIFAGNKYIDAIYVIPPIAASVFFIYIYSLLSTIEYYYQKTIQIAIATTLSAFLNLILNYIYIKKYGYYAAGYTTLVCYICLCLCHYHYYKKILINKLGYFGSVYDLKSIVTISMIVVILMLFMSLTYRFTFIRYVVIFILLIILLVKRKYIFSTINQIRKESKNDVI